ncbi:MAG: alpha/beta hydrolase, partial [Bacteroidales bacterium]|nr:alpha/beta hydrolase [Bacteroidales bacterium]
MEFFATAANIATHIEDSKKGEKTILLLHGYLETMYIWEEMYKDLSRDYRVIRIDLPGHGLTCTAPVNTMDLMATVAKGVLDVCGVKTATVVGHSMGGFVALKCCELFPDRFEKLVLLNSYPYAETDESRAIRAREQAVINSEHLATL